MSNSSTFTIACVLCVGAAPEPYLAPLLASIRDAVDVLAVNDNSGLARSENVAILEASAFGETGRLQIRQNPFVDFADMRNRAYAALRSLERPPAWVLFIDADEVHGEQIRYLAREVLPGLDARAGRLDAYTYHFLGTFGWITDIARRSVFYRFDPELHWVNAVHEVPRGVRGGTIVVPYTYHHYGNVVPALDLIEKHRRYTRLGDPTPRPVRSAPNEIFLEQVARVRPFRGGHPRVARPAIAEFERRNAVEFAALDAAFRTRRSAAMRLGTGLQAANEYLRVRLRLIEHPGLYRAPLAAR
jgi:hypothetical protein